MRNGSRLAVFRLHCVIMSVAAILLGALAQSGPSTSASIQGGLSECQTDNCTLLEFKKKLWNEGEPMLVTWRDTNVSNWRGVKWVQSPASGVYYAKTLDLGAFQLNGTDIAPLLHEGLSHLKLLNLSSNFFKTELPRTLRVCPDLEVLDLRNSSFQGSLPQNFSCGDSSGNTSSAPLNLKILDFGRNNFSGEVPSSLFPPASSAKNVRRLENISLEHNYLKGNVPDSVGNCDALLELKLANNQFGKIPFPELGNLSKLERLDVSHNYLGYHDVLGLPMPTEEGSFGSLKHLLLGNNWLNGQIPEELGNLSNLHTLELLYNNFTGPIPVSLTKLAKLQFLKLSFNSLNGSIPHEFNQLSNLVTLSLNHNKLKGTLIPQLSNCTKLASLWLGENPFGYAGASIPPELGNFTNLVVLSLFGSYLNKHIPHELGQLSELVVFDLGWNSLTEQIPGSLCNLHKLQVLFLEQNKLSGTIPGCFGNFSYIRLLDLSGNQLSGPLPRDLSSLSSKAPSLLQQAPDALTSAIYNQDVDSQNLNWDYSKSPISFICSSNRLTGSLPPSFGNMTKLQQLLLNSNNLTGSIPNALGDATSLYYIDLSSNNLSGHIPAGLTKLNFLSHLNVSWNNLSGQIPLGSQFSTFSNSSFSGNSHLCGLPLPACSSNTPADSAHSGGSYRKSIAGKLLPLYIILASAVVCVCFLGALFAWTWSRGCSRRSSSLVSNDGDGMYDSKDDLSFFQVTYSGALPQLTHRELASATENFNQNNIIGDGGFGLVYKARLNNGAVVAVKKLVEDGVQGQAEFLAEMRTLGGKIKHKNLVSLLGYCAYDKERLLVYEYMENGSLDTWLHCRDEGMASLDWKTRLKVARGSAEGLAYLHHEISPSIIHRDVKASNILLGCDFEARLADFGLARSTKACESHVSTDFAGTAGYIPPEYSQANAATTKGDVYSFGVVLLEILTGLRPMDPFFKRKDMSHVVNWVFGMSEEDALEKTCDMSCGASTDDLLELMRIACMCCQEIPSRRPNMCEVVHMLKSLERQQSPSLSPNVVLYDESMTSPRCR